MAEENVEELFSKLTQAKKDEIKEETQHITSEEGMKKVEDITRKFLIGGDGFRKKN